VQDERVAKVLLIEDNADLAYGLRNNLEIDGHSVETTETGEEALQAVRARRPDLIVLDLMLPKLDGYQVLRRLRAEGYEMPVLILTARTEEADKVLGFRLGADDYVTKPFGVLEVLARIEALLRRATRYAALNTVERFGQIEINRQTRTVTRCGVAVELTPMEFGLLVALVSRRGAIASRLDLPATSPLSPFALWWSTSFVLSNAHRSIAKRNVKKSTISSFALETTRLRGK
jgi:two-component system alkaline phosphatase synthesis response regulator PhoP